jgi:hypothetical protein
MLRTTRSRAALYVVIVGWIGFQAGNAVFSGTYPWFVRLFELVMFVAVMAYTARWVYRQFPADDE